MDCRLVFFLIGVTFVTANPPRFPECDYNTRFAIAVYWEGAGDPPNILKLTGTYRVLVSTQSKVFEKVKCRQYSFNPLTGIHAKYDDEEKNITASVDDADDGIIHLKESTVYVFSAYEGVIVTYQCSNGGPKPGKYDEGDANILVTDKADSNAIKRAKGLLRMLGFSMSKTYTC